MMRAACLVLLLAGCTAHTPSQSWSQDNLKRNDKGCPTAIFVAPKGELVQCQLQLGQPQAVIAVPEFSTAEQAALSGLRTIAGKPTALFYEWGGVIAKTPDGKYIALPSNTDFGGDHVDIAHVGLNDNTVIGTYHTHPCLPEHAVEYFSPPDLAMAIFKHYIVFMGDFCTGHVHEFIPGDKPDVEPPSGDSSVYLTKGRIIGQFTNARTMTAAD